MAPMKAIATWYPIERQASLGGWMMVAGGVGALVATAPLELALRFASWRAIFVALAATTYAVAIWIWLRVPDTRQADARAGFAGQWAGVRSVFANRRFWWIAPLGCFGIGSFMAVQGLWSVPWLMEVNGYDRAQAARHLLVMSVVMLGGYLLLGLFATRLARRGLRPQHLFGIGFALNAAALAAIVSELPGTLVWWALYGLGATANILAFTVLNEGFANELAARANTALNLLMFVGSFAMQWGIGLVIDAARTGLGYDTASGLQARVRDRACRRRVGVPLVRVGLATSHAGDANRTGMNADDLDVLLRAAGESAAAGDRKGAIAAYRKAIALAPERAELHYELGALLARAHRDGEALRAFAAAARHRPEWPEPWIAQGDLLFARGRYAESAGALEAAAARAPTRPDAWLKAAHALMRTKHWARAIPHLAHARELAPASEEIWAELRTLLLRSGRGEDADADFLRFDTVATPSARTVVTGLDVAMKRGDPAREAACLERALEWQYAEGDEGQVALLLSLLQYVDVRQERLYAIYRTYDRLQQARSRNVPPLAGQRGDTELPVRIGYLSADFRADVLGKLLLPVVTAHDTGRFAVRAYSLAPAESCRRYHRRVEGRRRRIRPARGARRSRGGGGDRGRRPRPPRRPDGALAGRAAGNPALQAGARDRDPPRVSRRTRAFAGRLQDHRSLRRHGRQCALAAGGIAAARRLRAAAVPHRACRRRPPHACSARHPGDGGRLRCVCRRPQALVALHRRMAPHPRCRSGRGARVLTVAR